MGNSGGQPGKAVEADLVKAASSVEGYRTLVREIRHGFGQPVEKTSKLSEILSKKSSSKVYSKKACGSDPESGSK